MAMDLESSLPEHHPNKNHQPYIMIIQKGFKTAIATLSGEAMLINKQHQRHQQRQIKRLTKPGQRTGPGRTAHRDAMGRATGPQPF